MEAQRSTARPLTHTLTLIRIPLPPRVHGAGTHIAAISVRHMVACIYLPV